MNTFDLSAFWSQFREETEENVRAITAALLALEADPGDRATLDGIFRAAHTIKGSARMLGQTDTGNLSHAMETVLGALRSGKITLTPSLNDTLLAGCDVILALVARVGEPPPTDERVGLLIRRLERLDGDSEADDIPPLPPPTPIATPPPAPALVPQTQPPPSASAGPAPAPEPVGAASRPVRQQQTVRVPISRLDRLLNTTGELVVGRQAQENHHTQLIELAELIGRQERTMRMMIQMLAKARVPTGLRRDLNNSIETLLAAHEQIDGTLRATLAQWELHTAATAALVDELEAEVMSTRLQPVAGLFAPIPRAVRELSRSLGKEVALITEGETTEADRKVIEVLADPLLHLVRNALDHGMEPPDVRLAAGKSSVGTLRLSARSVGGTIVLSVSDDGRGIDPQAVRRSALEKGLIDHDTAARLTDSEALELIWMPGFSTSAIITDISGRGVGMDVVRTAIVDIGGRVEIDSTIGVGTTIIITLPLTLLTTRVLLFEVAGALYALPSTACLGGLRVTGDEIQSLEGRPVVRIDGKATPIVALASLLELRGPLPQPSPISTIVVLGPASRPLALLVDRLVDEREAVIKALGPILSQQRLCSGAIALPDGRMVLLLNPSGLLDRARDYGRPTAPIAENQAPGKLLIAEDSFTTRELLRSILQAAGYNVEAAVDGRDALDKLQANNYDLVVSDVEMPHVNGFELTRRIREDQRISHLPVIIITSLARESDRREGLLAGAQAYIVKSQFDQSNLLETIRQLLGR